MAEKIKNFKDLKIWVLGKEIVIDIYNFARELPREELYGLTSQLKRSATSIPANIAEGFNRFHNKEYRQFLYIALGSCAELETYLEISFALNFLEVKSKKQMLEKLDYEQRMLRNLIKKLQ